MKTLATSRPQSTTNTTTATGSAATAHGATAPSYGNTSTASAPGTIARLRRMRIRQFLLAFVAFIALSAGAAAMTITITTGRSRLDCRGFGICSIVIGQSSAPNAVQAEATLAGDQITFAFQQLPQEHADSLTIDEAIPVESAIAHSLGAQRLTILPGRYAVDYGTNPNGTVTVPAQRVGITIDIEVGRRSKGCSGFGICSITIGADLTDRTVASVATLDGDELTLQLLGPAPEKGEALVIDEDIVLSKQITSALGSAPRRIKSGTYTVDYSTNPNGTVHVTTEAITITINVEIGRRSKGCTGFGICGITIGTELAADAVQAGVSRDGDGITLEMLEPMREHGDELVIDEDIVLDGATSRALGSRSMTIPHGTYSVDYSKNANGTVQLPVQAFGFTIDVRIGRPRFNCTGVGICSITIGFDANASDRSVPAIASIENDKLVLTFGKTLPETGDVMTIDDDIKLDPAMAAKLGSHDVVIRHGAYHITTDAAGNQSVTLDVARFGITIYIEVGRRSRGCTGFGICSITTSVELTDRTVPVVAVAGNGGLTLELQSTAPDRDSVLVIDEPIELAPNVAKALGIRGGTVLPGSYRVDYSKNPNGTVHVNMRSIGITIDITVGRPSRGCSGLGICRIDISLDAVFHGVPAVGSIENHKLALSFNGALPEQGDALTIDEDLTLDPQVARALGFKSVTITKGEYAIRRDSDGNAQVDMDVQTQGISIDIYFGRRSRSCRGFGICRIVLGAEDNSSSTERMAPAAGVLELGGLTLEMTATAPDSDSLLVIDEPVELDSATAAAFGVTAGTITPGSYPVDYSSNPFGTVRVPIQTPAVSGVAGSQFAGLATSAVAMPNPTTGRTTISFGLPHSGSVTIALSDASGREVTRLADDAMMSAGTHSVTFDASGLASGVYFYTIRSGAGVATGSVIVAR